MVSAIALLGCAQGEGVGPSDNIGGTFSGGAGGDDAGLGGNGGVAGVGASSGAGGGSAGLSGGAGVGGGAGAGGSTGGSAGAGGGATGGTSGTGGGATGGTSGTGGGATGGTGGGTGGGGTGGATGGTGGGATGGTGGGTGGSGGFGGCAIKSYDFTGCPGDFKASGKNSDWACGNPSSGPGSDHTGSGNAAWGTGLNGNSANCSDSTLTSPEIDLSSYSGQTVRIQFWHWHSMRVCDPNGLPLGLCGLPCALDNSTYSGGLVEVHDGTSWKKVTPITGYSNAPIDCYYVNSDGGVTCSACDLDGKKGFAGATGGWTPVEIDVSSYTHSKFKLRFHFASYDTDPCHPGTPGWYIDDVRVAKLTCP